MNMKYVKSNKAITLIALVVTIVVLLILAGISISMLTGNNGILNRATEARENTIQSTLEEEVSLKIMERTTEQYVGEAEDLGYYLEQVSGATVTQLADDVWYVTRDGAEVTVYEDGEIVTGKVDVWDGSSVACPVIEEDENKVFHWYIYTSSQLKFLADFTNNGNALSGTVTDLTSLVENAGYNPDDVTLTEDTIVYLMNDLDLGARQTDGELTSGTEWTPIGKEKDNTCVATFEGNENTIRGIYVNTDTNFNGIFGNTNTIKNLTIKDSYIAGATYTGGIVGALRTGNIENCHNENTSVILIEGEYDKVGGVCGQFTGTVISDCSNSGEIIGYGAVYNDDDYEVYAGGIVGLLYSSSTVMSCANSGSVAGVGGCIGGIVGFTFPSTTVISCSNKGSVSGENNFVGGIVGVACYVVTECENTGNVTGVKEVGGIVGTFVIGYQQQISKCYNSGSVLGVDQVGGISGYLGAQGYAGTETMCYNKGTVTASVVNAAVGGIIGKVANDVVVTNCYYYTTDTNLKGIGAINTGETDIDTARQGTILTNENIESYEDFIKWIEKL